MPRKNCRSLLLLVLFTAAFGIRLFHISGPPFAYHPTRQFYSLMIIHQYYEKLIQKHGGGPASDPAPHRISPPREPRIMEHLTSLIWFLSGGENYWMPRIFSILFWMVGGIFLYLSARMFFGFRGAGISLFVYLFFPFGIRISRAFMPESLMIMMFMAGMYFLASYLRAPSFRSLIPAAVFSGLAVLIKFVVVFPIVGGFAAARIREKGLKPFLQDAQTYCFLSIALLPGFLYYLVMLLFSPPLRGTIRAVLLPHIILRPLFWRGWLEQIGKVTGWTALFMGLVALIFMRDKMTRSFLGGCLAGYFLYGLVFSYPTATHDYYQVALFPVTAVILGWFGRVFSGKKLYKPPYKQTAQVLFSAFALLTLFFSLSTADLDFLTNKTKRTLASSAAFLCGNQLFISDGPDADQRIKIAEEIGRIVRHDTNTIFLARDYGLPLRYYGSIDGKFWPNSLDLWAYSLQGKEGISAAERFARYYEDLEAAFFIIEDMKAWREQPDLQKFVREKYSLVAATGTYMVYRQRSVLEIKDTL